MTSQPEPVPPTEATPTLAAITPAADPNSENKNPIPAKPAKAKEEKKEGKPTKREAKANSKAKEEKKVKDNKDEPFVLKPKKAASAWIFFNTETVARLKTEENLDHKQAFVRSAELWKSLSDEDKQPFIAKSTLDDERYKKQMAQLKEDGFFMTEDGKKSTELHVDPKKKYGADVKLPKKPLSAYLYFATA